MTKKKVSELSGAELNYWVAKVGGKDVEAIRYIGGHVECRVKKTGFPASFVYNPSEDWSQGGPIIEEERITVRPNLSNDNFTALKFQLRGGLLTKVEGSTPLIAAMRCFVASKFGE